MDLPPMFWPLLIIVSLLIFSMFALVVIALFRILDMGRTMKQTGHDLSEGLKSGQIEALKQAQEQMHRMGDRLQGLQNTLNERLEGQQQLLSQQLADSGKTVADLKKELGSLSEATGQLFDLGKDIASLEDILSSPKLRGGVGEIFLEKLLADIFPRSLFDIQHTFSEGVIVDAVIHIGDRMVPIDSKFPIEDFRRVLEAEEEDRPAARKQFQRNVKNKVDEIASKYILPDEGTYDFALMYIPAENIYYETILRDDPPGEMKGILDYSVSKRVIPVSPNSFYAYLQVILFGLKGMELERRGDEILSHLRRLQGDLDKFSDEYVKLGTHLSNARGAFERGDKRLAALDVKLSTLEDDTETPKLES
jgi:DNA recombination protein RmuC